MTRSVCSFGQFKPLVLCYHAVSATWDDELAVEPEAFEAQVRLALQSGYAPAGIEETVSGSRKILHVTFDDAFRNILGPLEFLSVVGVPATIFVCSDLAGEGLPLPLLGPGGARAAPAGEAETLTWDELRILAESGVEIGSHTCSHPRLTELSDGELRRELVESRQRLEDELGRPCMYLAYPFGDEDARVRAAARAAGYRASFAQASGLLRRDPHRIFRVSLYRHDAVKRASLKMSGVGRVTAELRRLVP